MRDILSDLEAGSHLSDQDPVRRAQIQMKAPLPKRFYKNVTVEQHDNKFHVMLDGRSVKTPAKNILALPTEAAAKLIADEFDAQIEVVNPETMLITRLANTAIDGIAKEQQAVFEDILNYAGNDMLFYRADAPERLIARQKEQWDPLIDWAGEFGAKFNLTQGVIHITQPEEAIAAFRAQLLPFNDPFLLASLHNFTTLTGSALIALALAQNKLSLEEAWKIAHLDEDWTIELWGSDEEAEQRREKRKQEMDAAFNFYQALR